MTCTKNLPFQHFNNKARHKSNPKGVQKKEKKNISKLLNHPIENWAGESESKSKSTNHFGVREVQWHTRARADTHDFSRSLVLVSLFVLLPLFSLFKKNGLIAAFKNML